MVGGLNHKNAKNWVKKISEEKYWHFILKKKKNIFYFIFSEVLIKKKNYEKENESKVKKTKWRISVCGFSFLRGCGG